MMLFLYGDCNTLNTGNKKFQKIRKKIIRGSAFLRQKRTRSILGRIY